MKIKAKSIFDYKTIKAFIRTSLFRKTDPLKKLLIYCFTFILLAVILWAEMSLLGPSVFQYILLGVCVAALLLELYLYFVIPRIRYHGLGERKDSTHEFLFTDDSVEFCSGENGYQGEHTIKYRALARVVETARYMYLFQDKNHALIVAKATISGGTALELREKLQSKLGRKYIIYKY